MPTSASRFPRRSHLKWFGTLGEAPALSNCGTEAVETCDEPHGVVRSQTMTEKEAEMIYWCNRHPSPACGFRHDLKNLMISVNIFVQMLWESKKEFLNVQRYKGHISCSKAIDFS